MIFCIVLIVALLPVVIMSKAKETKENKQKETFYRNCRSLKIGMPKETVLFILGDNYSFNCDTENEYFCWTKKLSQQHETIVCVVTLKNEEVVKIEMK